MANSSNITSNTDVEDLINKELNKEEQNIVDCSDKNIPFSMTNEHKLDDSNQHDNVNVTESSSEYIIDNKNGLITEVETQNLTQIGSGDNLKLECEEIHPNVNENNDKESHNTSELCVNEKIISHNDITEFQMNDDEETSKFLEHTSVEELEPTALITDYNDPTEKYVEENHPPSDKLETYSNIIDDGEGESNMNAAKLEFSDIRESKDMIDVHSLLEVTSLSSLKNDEIDRNKCETVLEESFDHFTEEKVIPQHHENVHLTEENEKSEQLFERITPQEVMSLTEPGKHTPTDKNDIPFDFIVHDVNDEIDENLRRIGIGGVEGIIQTPHEKIETKFDYDISTSVDQPNNGSDEQSDTQVDHNEEEICNLPSKSYTMDYTSFVDHSKEVEFPVVEEQTTTEFESHHKERDNSDLINTPSPSLNHTTEQETFRADIIADYLNKDDYDDDKTKLYTEDQGNVGKQDHLQCSMNSDSSNLQQTNSPSINDVKHTEINEIKNRTSLSDKDICEENGLESGQLLYATQNLINELQTVEHLTDDRPEPLNIAVDIQGDELYNAKIHKRSTVKCYVTEQHSNDDDKHSISNYEVENISPKYFEEHQSLRDESNHNESTTEELNNQLKSKPLNDVNKNTALRRIRNDVDEISLNSEGEQRTEFEQRYAELIAKYLPVERQSKKNDRSRRTKTLDRYSKSKFNENRYSYIDTSDVKKRSVTLERNEFKRKRRLQPKPSVNDDYLYPDSVTPSKVDKSISVRSLEEGIPEGAYDVPYIDDDAFLPRRLRENKGEDNGSDEGSSLSLEEDYCSWNPDRFSRLEANHIADTNECAPTPENQPKSKTITSILSKKKKDQPKQILIVQPTTNGNKSKNKGKSLICGCVSRKSKNR
ncbi:ribosome binding protein 1 [Schistosoma haematobium]|uniref:Ribosome binding protein 1 n=1 Tax=Schistosoma haematobium TaxID=6185 RepID=A0A922INW1_SCHHA|nr:ribosome binding protein 1 [Schistosoma haematobium]KAH9582895.1 ribosome binding protein 1 [Schistosoma haematobium]CAH8589451.1 unnamed protein product [Schistosoma haematobium]CAH8596945.1 unnamed protein product [Schistosoma haematobium]